MDPIAVAIIGIIGLLVLLFLGVPVGFAMSVVGVAGLFALGGSDVAINAIQRIPFTAVVTSALIVIPLFVVMGEAAVLGGVAQDAFSAFHKIAGRVRGSIAIAAIGAAGAFGAVSGSSIATSLTIGKPAYKEMESRGYNPKLSTGTIAAGGTIGALMPPSFPLIVFALVANISIADMFLAAIFPALLKITLYALMIMVIVTIKPHWEPRELRSGATSIIEKISAVPKLIPISILAGTVFACIYWGWVSLTETAALGAFIAILIWVVRKGLLKGEWGGAGKAAMSAVRVTSMIGLILIGSALFVSFLAFSGLPPRISEMILNAGFSKYTFILASVILFLILGAFLETLGMMLITIPFLLVTVTQLDIDIIWYGILFMKVAEVGMISPPVGLNVYVVKGIAPRARLSDVFAGASIFIVCDLLAVAAIVAFPEIVLWLPQSSG